MKAIYLIIILLPIYLLLILGDFLNDPNNLIIPASVLLVCAWQVLGPTVIKRALAPQIINLIGAVCAAGSFIYGWYLVLGAAMDPIHIGMVLFVWTALMMSGFARMITRYEKDAVSITAAGGLSMVLTGILIKLLLMITGEALFVFFAVSLVPLTLVLFFYSMNILMKRPEPV